MTRATREALVSVYGVLLKAGWDEPSAPPAEREPSEKPGPRTTGLPIQ